MSVCDDTPAPRPTKNQPLDRRNVDIETAWALLS
jgi:hypothetical protein